ncbi:hypothetical protein GY14_24525 [Delftia tsuruhatensis]|nr:hypothetical protein GY14_24525 [Delftia tsuruhatensis]
MAPLARSLRVMDSTPNSKVSVARVTPRSRSRSLQCRVNSLSGSAPSPHSSASCRAMAVLNVVVASG